MDIRVVYFDLGKVLIDFDWQIGLERMASKSTLSADEISVRMRADEQMLVYEVGKIESLPFFQHLKGVLEYSATPFELRSCFVEIFTPIDKHIALLRAVAAHYPVGLISNTNEAHISYAMNSYDFFSVFNTVTLSNVLHFMKPEPEIYQAALTALEPFAGGPINPATVLFIDDLAPNVAGAQSLGWQTIHLLPTTDLEAELRAKSVKGI